MPEKVFVSKRMNPILDHHLQHAIDKVNGQHDERGHYGTVIYDDLPSKEAAAEYVKAIYRSAYHMKVSLFYQTFQQPDGRYSVKFTVVHKERAREYINAKKSRGEQLAYNPRAPRGPRKKK